MNNQQLLEQQYCLRWNNHRSNLLTVFDQLLQNEAFTDVTLACEGGSSVKCHKMVLAACSTYFQCLFTELPCRHPVVVLKDVRYTELKSILEYMYRGEVNVAQDQLKGLLKIAEALKIKGLVEDNGNSQKKRSEEEGNAITTSTTAFPHASSSVNNDECPPHSTGIYPAGYSKSPYLYGKSGGERSSSRSGASWPVSGFPVSSQSIPSTHAGSPSNRCYDVVTADTPPLRRKKLSSLLMSRDTPILRTVLGQGQADSSQPVPLVCRPDSLDQGNLSPFTNGSGPEVEKNIKPDPALGDAPSPYTDISTAEEDNGFRNLSGLHSSAPHSMFTESKGSVSSAIATFGPSANTAKPEWKRYKQYSKTDIMAAIEAVRNGMSALQASRMFGVPSRTLYDKVKKLGITTKPLRRNPSSNGSAAFPYGLSSTVSKVYGSIEDETKYSHSMMEHGFLQHALEAHDIKREEIEREAMVAMVAVSNAETNSRSSSSPRTSEHPLSPNLIKFAHRQSPSPRPDQNEEDSNQVEDLSITRKTENTSGSRVIMPPMSQANSMVTTGNDPQDSTD